MDRRCRLILMRHGETDWNVDGRWQGHSDTPLNETGRGQARAAASHFEGLRFEAVYASDLSRAAETAELVVGGAAVICREPDLREVSLGAWEGLRTEEIMERWPDTWKRRMDDPAGHEPPGGEALVAVASRVRSVFDRIVARHGGETVLVVSHGMALASLFCSLEGIDLKQARDLLLDNAAHRDLRW